jgi:hypothetical protein
MAIKLRKSGTTDGEASEYLDKVSKALDRSQAPITLDKMLEESPNPADSELLVEAHKSFNKMIEGILSDVTDILGGDLD